MKVIIIGIILILLPLVCSASDRSVAVRDRYGNITLTEHYDGQGQKTIRDRAGNIIGAEDRD